MSAIDGKQRDPYRPEQFDPFHAREAKQKQLAAEAEKFSSWVAEQEAAKCQSAKQ